MESAGYNQSPNAFSNDLTTNEDLNGIANAREHRGQGGLSIQKSGQNLELCAALDIDSPNDDEQNGRDDANGTADTMRKASRVPAEANSPRRSFVLPQKNGDGAGRSKTVFHTAKKSIFTFCKFVGPGFMIAVAYSKFTTLIHVHFPPPGGAFRKTLALTRSPKSTRATTLPT
jgi:metal iron transporter